MGPEHYRLSFFKRHAFRVIFICDLIAILGAILGYEPGFQISIFWWRDGYGTAFKHSHGRDTPQL
jgi:hypothetical protein